MLSLRKILRFLCACPHFSQNCGQGQHKSERPMVTRPMSDTGSYTWLCFSLTVGPWEDHRASVSPHFHVCEMRIDHTRIPVGWGFGKYLAK